MLGSCSAFTFTTAGGAVTLTNIVSASIQPSVTVNEKYYASPHPYITLGNISYTANVVTTDPAVLSKVTQGVRVTAVTATFDGVATAIDPDNLDLTFDVPGWTETLSSGFISDIMEIAASNDSKEPVAYSITIKSCQTEAKANPTFTREIVSGE